MVQCKISIFYRSILLISLYLGIFQDVFFFTAVLRESLVISYCLGCTVLHYVISNSCNEEEFPVKMLSGARQMSFKRFRLHILLEFSQLYAFSLHGTVNAFRITGKCSNFVRNFFFDISIFRFLPSISISRYKVLIAN